MHTVHATTSMTIDRSTFRDRKLPQTTGKRLSMHIGTLPAASAGTVAI
jgi:hypothetical protein